MSACWPAWSLRRAHPADERTDPVLVRAGWGPARADLLGDARGTFAGMNPVTALSLGRVAIGVAALVRPQRVSALLGSPTPQAAPLMTQWFGTRELALGLVTLVSGGAARRQLVLAGMLADAGDAGTAYLGVRNGTLPHDLGWAAVAIAGGACAVAPLGLIGRTRRTPPVLVS